MESHNVNDESDQVEGVNNDVINEFLNLIESYRTLIYGGSDDQLILDGDLIDDILQEGSECASSGDQMLHHVEKGITKMRLDAMV